MAPVSASNSVLEDISDLIFPQAKPLSIGLPSKVEALVSDLKTLSPDVKWYFSNATSLFELYDRILISLQRYIFDLETDS
jgi:hypothetical protein